MRSLFTHKNLLQKRRVLNCTCAINTIICQKTAIFTSQAVYGGVPKSSSAYPLCVGDSWMFYDDIINASNITDIPKSVVVCPSIISAEGQRYWTNNNLSPPWVSWSWHGVPNATNLVPRRPFANNTWIEVIHERFPSDEKTGAWFYYTKVSLTDATLACVGILITCAFDGVHIAC